MLKETTYKQKITLLEEWMPTIIELIKRDLKNEHLRDDLLFYKKYFNNKNLSKISNEELLKAYTKAIQEEERGEDLAEFVLNRWLLKNAEIYNYFEEALLKICPNFTELTELDVGTATDIMEDSIKKFGASNTYLFAIINSVVFPHQVYEQLRFRAKEQVIKAKMEEEKHHEYASMASLQQAHQQQLNRLTDKYESKLLGMQKKYTQDVASLKKQIASLQCKLNEK